MVNLGGLDAIIYLCGSYVEEVMTVAVGSLETIALHGAPVHHCASLLPGRPSAHAMRRTRRPLSEEVQNTLVAKGALVVLFRICTSSNITNLTALNSVASVLFTLSRNGDLCRHIVAENGLHPLMALCSRTLASFQTTPKDQQLLGDVQSLGARAISYLAMNRTPLGPLPALVWCTDWEAQR